MPVQIGKSSPDFSKPIALMADCHRRFEMFLSTLEKVADAGADQLGNSPELDDSQRQALEKALRYFREAAPKHTADEEESLFPRLRDLGNPQMSGVLSALQALEVEHQWAQSLHDDVDRIGSLWLKEGSVSPTELQSLRTSLTALQAMYRRHIALEEEVVFPAAAQALSSQQEQEIGQEMKQRRNLTLNARLWQ